MSNYSKDVFFEPWVGDKYEDGIKFNNNNVIESGDRKDKENKAKDFYKVMVLGKEHYCDTIKHCEDRNKEQEFYLESIKKIKNLHEDEIKAKIEQLYTLYEDETINSITKYKDKLYALYEKNNRNIDNTLQQISKYNIKKEDLELYLAIEKVLTVNVLWTQNSEKKENQSNIEKEAKNLYNFTTKYETQEKNKRKCNMHKSFKCPCCGEQHKCTSCGQLPICKYKTRRQIYDYIEEIETKSTSHKNFQAALGQQNNPKIWNHLLFTNFFQKSMPYITNNLTTDIKNASSIISKIITTHKPDILITWTDQVFTWLIENLPEGITAITKKYHPEIQIGKQEDPPTFTFTIIQWKKKGEDHSCLVLMCRLHPSAPKFNKKEQTKFNQYICCVFQNYKKIIAFNPSKLEDILKEIIDLCYKKQTVNLEMQKELEKYENEMQNDTEILNIFNKAKDANGKYTELSKIRKELIKNLEKKLIITI